MTDLIYIGLARLHRAESWVVVSASDDMAEVVRDLDKFHAEGYKTKVDTTFLYMTENMVNRIWRTRQKTLENQAMDW